MHTFEIGKDFLLDGKPFQIISGSIHYFRVPPAYWEDRLVKLRAMGANTVETYVPWNLHEPEPGQFSFDGELDIARFLELAQSLGLWAIVRPSPYICAEWEFGGLPAWLLREEDVPLRTPDPLFLDPVARYYEKLLPILAAHQVSAGGNILLFQVENEYGSYGTDKVYLQALADLMRKGGLTQPFITSDGPTEECLKGGTLPGVHPTVNTGAHVKERLPILRDWTDGPLMVMELWDGWFDAWGGPHARQNPQQVAQELKDALTMGSANLYMFHGGTSFGFMNGANYYDRLTPDVTSYDYAAPLAEDGTPTASYYAVQVMLERMHPGSTAELPPPIPKRAYGELPCLGRTDFFENVFSSRLGPPLILDELESLERLGQSTGFILYYTCLTRYAAGQKLQIPLARDRVQIYLNGEYLCTCSGEELEQGFTLPKALKPEDRLWLLVENLGRVNFGPKLTRQRKGLEGPVYLDGVHLHYEWGSYHLPLTDLSRLQWKWPVQPGMPSFSRFCLETDEPADTFLACPGYGKVVVFVNGRALGRLWDIGPQKRLYLPAPWLHRGQNEIIVLETEGVLGDAIVLHDTPDLG